MVKHIILWKLKEEYNNDEIKQGIKDGLEGLKGKIPGLLEITVRTEKLESSNTDAMLYSVFENEESLKGYSNHPLHLAVANEKVRPFTESRACMDYFADN